jgi:CBS domain-containing protein
MANDENPKRGAESALRRGVNAGADALREAGTGAAEQADRAAQSMTQAAGTYGAVARGAAEEMQALMRVPTAAIGGLQEVSLTWSRVLGQAMETNARFSQELLRCRTVQDVAEVQGRFLRESLAGLRESGAELLRATRRLAEHALEPMEEGGREGEEPGIVADVMSRDVKVASPDDTVEEVAKIMAKADTGVLPVGEGDKLVGMITDRDLAVRVVAAGKDPAKTPVREAMTKEVKYCFEDEHLDHVAENMAELRLRRLPVVTREKRLVGIVSLGDLATEAAEAPHLAGRALGGVAQEGGPHRQRLPSTAARAAAGSKPGTKRGRGRPAKARRGK